MKQIKRFFYLLSAILGFGFVLIAWLMIAVGDVGYDLYKSSLDFWLEIIEDLKHIK